MDLTTYHLSGEKVSVEEFHDLMHARGEFFTDDEIEANDLRMDRVKTRPTMIRRSLLNLLDDPTIPDDQKKGLDAFFPLQEHATHLLCQRLKVPYKFFKRCWQYHGDDGFRLDCYINRWLEDRGKTKFLVRFDSISGKPEIRAILSSRYVDLSNEDMALELRNFPESKDFQVRFEWTPKHLFATLVSGKTKLLSNGQELSGGIRIRNSEVGMSSAVCEMMVLKETDKSGAIIPGYDGFRRTHLQTKEDFQQAFNDSINGIIERMENALDAMAQTQEIELHDAHEMVIAIGMMNNLDAAQVLVVKEYQQSATLSTLYDVIQLFAISATDAGLSVERREKLQRIAGELVFNMKRYGRWAKN